MVRGDSNRNSDSNSMQYKCQGLKIVIMTTMAILVIINCIKNIMLVIKLCHVSCMEFEYGTMIVVFWNSKFHELYK
jgi:hypothetical protein